MKIPEAIEILYTIDASTDWPKSTVENNAIKLGIEALKRLQYQRKQMAPPPDAPLSGETL